MSKPIKIFLKEESQGAKMFKEIVAKKQERKKAILEEYEMPDEIRNFIKEEVESTFKLNAGNLDKQSYRLGLSRMWFHLNKKYNVFNNIYSCLRNKLLLE